MAGADQKSFLASFSPWSTPRSATPQSGLDRQHGHDALQRSQGEDHTVTHTHKLSLRLYPQDCPPLKVRWFYAVDLPKRKPVLLEQKKPDQKPQAEPKKFVPFSPKDSQSIEAAFQKLSETEDARRSDQAQEPKTTERVPTKVPVNEDYLFDVDVEQRELGPAYWLGPIYEVRRGTWFFQDGSGLRPCEENLATQLEEGYLKLRPWRSGSPESVPGPNAQHQSGRTGASAQDSTGLPSSAQPAAGNATAAPTGEPQQYRLFGAYMNRIVAYQDSSTAWLTNDDFMSRFSTTVYQKLGAVPGTKVVRGYIEPKRPKETVDSRSLDRKPSEKPSAADRSSSPPPTPAPKAAPTSLDSPTTGQSEGKEDPQTRPISTLERQMSSLAGQPQNPAELEEQARKQEEQEMEGLREDDGEDREREIDHLVLVTHGIGQRLGLRLESINFIHDVNVLRKTLKGVYRASPDLQALNAAFGDSSKNCRVQVLPVCWRHLLDFPYRGVRQNRKEMDLADADALEDEPYPGLQDITLESVPAVRNLISDLAMDVLLYQSRYCEHISNIVKQECNRILALYKQRNPSFKGSVVLCGHSLGSAILFDILCQQPAEVSGAKQKRKSAHGHDPAGYPGGRQNALNFECEEFFCLGSPLALFQMLKGKKIAGQSMVGAGARSRNSDLDVGMAHGDVGPINSPTRDRMSLPDASAILSTPRCRDLYNIFHPSDPVSYRIEPLISPAMATLKPQPLPSVKRSIWTTSGQSLSILSTRMGQSVGSLWTNFTTGVASNLLNRSLGLHADDASSAASGPGKVAGDLASHKRTQSGSIPDASHEPEDQFHTLIEADLETLYDGFQKRKSTHQRTQSDSSDVSDEPKSEDQDRKMRLEDAKVRALNANGRVDYSVQEGAFDISLIASIASHLTYWGDEDVNHFLLSQMLSRNSRQRRKPTA